MNKFEQRSRDSYDKKAKDYDTTFDGRFTEKFKQILLRNVKVEKGDAVADIACGNGRFLKMLSEQYDFVGYGTDISEKMIDEARKNNPEMSFSVAGCENLPFGDGEIAAMTVSAAYHHFPNVEKFADEAGRVIKSGGLLYIAEVYLPGILRVLFNPFLKFSKAGDVKFYSAQEIQELFERKAFIKKDTVVAGKVQLVIMQKV